MSGWQRSRRPPTRHGSPRTPAHRPGRPCIAPGHPTDTARSPHTAGDAGQAHQPLTPQTGPPGTAGVAHRPPDTAGVARRGPPRSPGPLRTPQTAAPAANRTWPAGTSTRRSTGRPLPPLPPLPPQARGALRSSFHVKPRASAVGHLFAEPLRCRQPRVPRRGSSVDMAPRSSSAPEKEVLFGPRFIGTVSRETRGATRGGSWTRRPDLPVSRETNYRRVVQPRTHLGRILTDPTQYAGREAHPRRKQPCSRRWRPGPLSY